MGIYVLQVAGGQERRAAELARRLLGNKLGDCFAPVRELKKRKAGQWRTVKELVFPGYLFLETEDPENVYACLRQAPVLMRLLTSTGDEFLPGESSEQVQRLVVVDLPGTLPLETLAWSPVE